MTTTVGLEEGTLLAGKYRVLRILGQGGMGVVVAARHLELDQLVAVKFLHHGALSNTDAVARFTREARAAARIKSEHVARVIDVSRLEDGAPYMVLEYLEGEDLAQRLNGGPLSVEETVDYVVQACDALAEAHAAGIVHRDLKPSNLFLTRRPNGEGLVKVLDFGISKLLSGEPVAADLTGTAAMMGSPLYMSPEQMRSARDVDARADLWALGVILYELLARHPPFSGDSLPEVINAVMSCQPTPLSSYRSDVPAALERTILSCLAKERTERLQSVAELVAQLADFVPRRSQHVVARVRSLPKPESALTGADAAAGVSAAAAALTPGGSGITAPAWSGTRSGKASKPASPLRKELLFVGGLALLLVGIAFSFIANRSHNAGEATPIVSTSAGAGSSKVDRRALKADPNDAGLASAAVHVTPSAPGPIPSAGAAISQPSSHALNPARAVTAKLKSPTATPTVSVPVPATASAAPSVSTRRRNLEIELK